MKSRSFRKKWLIVATVCISCFFNVPTHLTASTVSRDDPSNHVFTDETDTYLEGYIQALVNAYYYEFAVLVYVENGDVYLYNLPKNELIKKSIIRYVSDLPSVKSVTEVSKFPKDKQKKLEEREVKPNITGIWFPQTTLLYPPMIANPMATVNSVAYRWGDRVLGNNTIAVSVASYFPLYRWNNVFIPGGDLQFTIQAGVWSVFNMWVDYPNESAELMNTDYLIGFPISYAYGKWAFRLRPYHISTHLGDEYMAHNPGIRRVNPSNEAVDFFVSYQATESLRVYAGPGWVFHTDRTYPFDPFYIEYGGEATFFGYKSYQHKIYGTFFVAAYWRNWQTCKWSLDGTYMVGYEWSKFQGLGKKLRLFVNYHHGYSPGQFFKERTAYGGIGAMWGF